VSVPAGPPGAPQASTWNIANVVTMSRVAMVPAFAWAFLTGSVSGRLLAVGIFVLAAVTDRLDGYLARSRNLVTDFGKIADPIADKALTITALVLLSSEGLVPWWVTIVIIVRELGITLLRFLLVRRSVIAASSGGKLKTVLQLVFLGLLLVPWYDLLPSGPARWIEVAALVIMYAAVVVTVVTGVQYVVRAAQGARAHGGPGPGRA
jgi:CDP-diacylglycerol--glycerol-3-phosphate 3-phosphatidyltransferase